MKKGQTIQEDSPLTTEKGNIHLQKNVERFVKPLGKTAAKMIHGSNVDKELQNKENYYFNNEKAVEAFKKTNSQQFIQNLENSGKKITNMRFKV